MQLIASVIPDWTIYYNRMVGVQVQIIVLAYHLKAVKPKRHKRQKVDTKQ